MKCHNETASHFEKALALTCLLKGLVQYHAGLGMKDDDANARD